MNRRTFACASLAVLTLVALPLSACGAVPLPTYHYRLTVEVDTPQGPRTGSSVIEVSTASINRDGFPAKPNYVLTRFKGEAVAVDLPGGQALLRSRSSNEAAGGYAWALFNIPHADGPDGFFTDLKRLVTMRGRSTALPRHWPNTGPRVTWHQPGGPPSAWPMLVRFANIRDPKSVELVDPDRLDRSFGRGVRLRRITVQLTNEPGRILR